MERPSFTPPSYAFLGDATISHAELRIKLASGELKAFMTDARGKFWEVPATRWNTEASDQWLRTGRAPLTFSTWRVIFAPEQPVVSSWIFIKLPETPVAKDELKSLTKLDSENRYANWVAEEVGANRSWSRDDDERHAKTAFGIDRERARELREKYWPPNFRKIGRKPRV